MPANNDVHDSSGVAPAHQSNVSFSSQSTGLTSNSASQETENSNRLGSDDQLGALTALLERENRIKEGAEKFLKLPITDTMRMQVESELEMATNEIEILMKRIEQETSRGKRRRNGVGPTAKRKFAGQAPPSTVRFRADSDDRDRDDFRTALNQANSYLKSLVTISRPSSSTLTMISSSSTSTGPTNFELDKARIDVMNKLVSILQRNLRVRYELSMSELVQASVQSLPAFMVCQLTKCASVIPSLSDRSSKHCRSAAYRLIRHSLVDSASVEELNRQPLEWFIVKWSLARDNKHAVEREQVIKLIRAVVDIVSEKRDRRGNTGSTLIPLSEPIMRAFVAVSEHAEDPFRQICVQTLAEMSLLDIDLVARTGGIRFLLHALGEGPVEIGPILAATFLHIIDSPRTRAYLRLGIDVEIALLAVTDAYGRGSDHAERMRSCTKVIELMLRTWSGRYYQCLFLFTADTMLGLMYFCMDDQRAIKSIVNTLRIPSLDTREIILDMFFDLLNIKAPEWYKTFIDGRRLTMYRKPRNLPERVGENKSPERPPETLKLTDQYIALLILVFTNAGLLDALTCMLEESTIGSSLTRKATLLMGEIMQMANRVLPLAIAANIQAIPRIFNLASDYNRGEHRIIGTSAISAIDSFNRNRARLQPNVKGTRPRANSSEDAVRRGQRQVEHSKIKISMQMDDKTFQSCLLETQVNGVMSCSPKDNTKWNFDILHELIDGPLLNPKRLEEAIKVSRFMRRLMSFFHPFSHRFSDLPRKQPNLRWVRLGCNLLTTLLASPDGVRFLMTEDDFLNQIVKSFAQLDPFNGTPESDPIFSKARILDTLTYGYFEMLGTLCKHPEGLELMEKSKIFTAFYHLSELRDREDLITAVLMNLDYTIDGHPRVVLLKALTSEDVRVRLFATNHLGELIRNSLSPVSWSLRLLLTQLYDPSPEVCEMAIQFLEEACDAMEVLQLVVEMQPTMDHLGEIGHPLLLKFMSTPMGFRYLYNAGYIDREMDMWFHERNTYYVVQVEIFLAKVFSSEAAEDDEDVLRMSKTELGCQVLSEKGHFAEFSHFIRQHGLESEDLELILKLKSILWAVGNVGATEGGLPFLEEEEIIPSILDIAEHSLIPSVRGTCFFVLGLISSTTQGAEILDDYRWEATLSPLGLPTGLCVPVDLDRFISLPTWEPIEAKSNTDVRLLPPTVQTELEVITAIDNLSNTVIANAASRSLARMKSRPEYRSAFTSPTVFFRALHIISTQRYRLPVRRYILDLFNIELDHDVIKAICDAAVSLRAPPSFKQSEAHISRVVSMLGPKYAGRESDSDAEEDDSEMDDMAEEVAVKNNPVIMLRPHLLHVRERKIIVIYVA
ncbi:Rapamycin-insensitive companion of mTOR, N-term-domain-containing protein [Lanmaoa asiatica]|nr:Rapamycin-insensitive companion of mTOR, N-term-domain-containing protein [Lanmaoa asiatica]